MSGVKTFVTHEVMFLLDADEGEVVAVAPGRYGRLSGVTVRLDDRDQRVSASARRCRKDGGRDLRMGNVYTPAEPSNPAVWVKRASDAVRYE